MCIRDSCKGRTALTDTNSITIKSSVCAIEHQSRGIQNGLLTNDTAILIRVIIAVRSYTGMKTKTTGQTIAWERDTVARQRRGLRWLCIEQLGRELLCRGRSRQCPWNGRPAWQAQLNGRSVERPCRRPTAPNSHYVQSGRGTTTNESLSSAAATGVEASVKHAQHTHSLLIQIDGLIVLSTTSE